MLLVLLLLCAYFSYVTWEVQYPSGAGAAEAVAADIAARWPVGASVVIVAGEGRQDREFAEALRERLEVAQRVVLATVTGSPRDARLTLQGLPVAPDVLACSSTAARWAVIEDRARLKPELARAALVHPAGYGWPSFLKPDNLRNITSQIAVIAILAVGMTLVIITGGIDLSVGSLIALSAVVATLLIQEAGGGTQAAAPALWIACLCGIATAAVLGLFSGVMVTFFAIPPFIVTLAMMLVARGLAGRLTASQSVYRLPESFVWLGRGADVLGIPNAVVLMVVLYLLAHVLMTRMVLGRYIYAVGGNAEAARLSGVPVRAVLLFVYTLGAALAGLGGIVMASQLKSGVPTYGLEYELYVIAAVVVGGTSLRGGQGRVVGTLIGALIIAVIQNGMNLQGVESDTQKIVLGLVLLGAVVLDTLKRGGWRLSGAA
jgi:ribose transport system permease protein